MKSTETPNDLIGNGARDLPACSIVSQPTTLPRAPTVQEIGMILWNPRIQLAGSQDPCNGQYPKSHQSSSPDVRSILILSSHLSRDRRSGFFP
jgi:hypothetical protein